MDEESLFIPVLFGLLALGLFIMAPVALKTKLNTVSDMVESVKHEGNSNLIYLPDGVVKFKSFGAFLCDEESLRYLTLEARKKNVEVFLGGNVITSKNISSVRRLENQECKTTDLSFKDFSSYSKNEVKNFYIKYEQHNAAKELEKISESTSVDKSKRNRWFSDEAL